MNSTKVSVKHRTRNDGKPVLCEYQPLQGFYDLRNWDIPKKDFLKLWGIQKYLFQCEQNRQKGLYKNMPNELEKVKNLSAEYQQTLFSYTNVGGFAPVRVRGKQSKKTILTNF